MLKNIKLERPLAFIDVETTGINPYSDRVVELSILRIQAGWHRGVQEPQGQPGDAHTRRGDRRPRHFRRRRGGGAGVQTVRQERVRFP